MASFGSTAIDATTSQFAAELANPPPNQQLLLTQPHA